MRSRPEHPAVHPMSLTPVSAAEGLARLDHYDTIIDARSEGEFALDRLPGAVNWPSLNDAERALVGTEYKQVSPFVARKRGAALVARNVAMHIERHVLDKPKDWQPLIYCWRGGQRSGALSLVLSQIGFRVQVIEGGYQAYRRAVIAALETQPLQFRFRVVCGQDWLGQEPSARSAAGARRAGARSGRPGQSPRIGARPGAREPATDAEAVRFAPVGCDASLRSGTAGVGGKRKPQGRRVARARAADRVHAGRSLRPPGTADRRPRGVADGRTTTSSSTTCPRSAPGWMPCGRCAATRSSTGGKQTPSQDALKALCASCWSPTTTRCICSRCNAISPAFSDALRVEPRKRRDGQHIGWRRERPAAVLTAHGGGDQGGRITLPHVQAAH